MVVLDNVPFHTAGVVREREEEWEARGLVLYRLPAYCPHRNLIEGVWRRLKGISDAAPIYDSVADLKQAVFAVYAYWELWEIQCSLEILSAMRALDCAPFREYAANVTRPGDAA